LFFLLIKDKIKFLLGVLIISITFSARLRFFSEGVHQGGAELAVVPFDFPLIAIFFFWFVEAALGKGKKIKLEKVDIAILLFFVACILSMINSSYYSFSLYELLRIVKFYFLFLFVRSYVTSWRDLRFVILFLCIALLIQSFFGFLQAVFGSSLGLNIFERTREIGVDVQGISRVEGTLGHPNGLAQFLNMSVFLILASMYSEKKDKIKFLYSVVVIISIVLLGLTLSRSGWTAFILSFIIFKFISGRSVRTGERLSNKRYYAMGILIILLMLSFIFRNAIYERIKRAPASTLNRILLLEVTYNMATSHPMIGVGINNFTEVMKNYDTTGVSDYFPAPVHNIYALVLAETGIIGLFFFLLTICFIVANLYRSSRSSDRNVIVFSGGILAGIVSALISGMLTWGLRGDSLLLMFWLLAGLGYAVSNIYKRRRSFTRDRSII